MDCFLGDLASVLQPECSPICEQDGDCARNTGNYGWDISRQILLRRVGAREFAVHEEDYPSLCACVILHAHDSSDLALSVCLIFQSRIHTNPIFEGRNTMQAQRERAKFLQIM